jgi:hypothetical protein
MVVLQAPLRVQAGFGVGLWMLDALLGWLLSGWELQLPSREFLPQGCRE